MKKLVIIPTYNERENVSRMISKVMSLFGGYDLLIVDDGSPDGTAAIVRGRQEEFPGRVHLIERSGKLGLGTAYIAGFRWALAHGYDLVYEMDCDFSHNPDDLERLTAAVTGGADVAVGSRYSRGVNVVNWPMSRLLMSYYASKYVRIAMPVNLRRFFPSKTLRNFITMVYPSIDPRLGDYTFEEIVTQVHHYMRYYINSKFLRGDITTATLLMFYSSSFFFIFFMLSDFCPPTFFNNICGASAAKSCLQSYDATVSVRMSRPCFHSLR